MTYMSEIDQDVLVEKKKVFPINIYSHHLWRKIKIPGETKIHAVLKIWASAILRLFSEVNQTFYCHISTSSTTVCKVGPGRLMRVIVNYPSNDNITIYDGTSLESPIMAIINPGKDDTPFSLDYDVAFLAGLIIVTDGSSDLTVGYK